jgi:hypothetical protein
MMAWSDPEKKSLLSWIDFGTQRAWVQLDPYTRGQEETGPIHVGRKEGKHEDLPCFICWRSFEPTCSY